MLLDGWLKMSDYPDRVCPVCGLTFTPKHKRQIYDRDYCRVKANREQHKGIEQPPEVNWMLEEIRRIDAVAAGDLEQLAKELGLAYANKYIGLAYRLVNRGGIVQARNVLIEAGEVTPKKKRKPAK